MRLYMMRHGESEDDVEDCYGGIADFPLTDKGRDQARALGRSLENEQIEGIYSSPLARADESARLIAAELGPDVTVQVIDDLQERNTYGVLSGVNKARAAKIFKRVLDNLKEKPGYSRETVVGGEDYELFLARVRRAFTRVVDDATKRGWTRVGVVTHGKFSKALFEGVLALEGQVDTKLSALNVIEHRLASAKLIDLKG